jgi:hypothetical protein
VETTEQEAGGGLAAGGVFMVWTGVLAVTAFISDDGADMMELLPCEEMNLARGADVHDVPPPPPFAARSIIRCA